MKFNINVQWKLHVSSNSVKRGGASKIGNHYFGPDFKLILAQEHPSRDGQHLMRGVTIVTVNSLEEIIGRLMTMYPKLPQPWVVRQCYQDGVITRVVGGPTLDDRGGSLRCADFEVDLGR